jgi:hypothetical protein
MAKRPVGAEDKRPVGAEEEIVRANVHRSVVPGPNFVSLYANDTQIRVTPWDIMLIFGEIDGFPTVDNPSVNVKLNGEVRMSPQHAKRLLLVLQRQIDLYEQAIGPIPLPREP